MKFIPVNWSCDDHGFMDSCHRDGGRILHHVRLRTQLVKIWRQGGRDLSYGMLTLYLIGAVLWFIYGVLVHAQAVIIINFATAIVIALATAMKALTARRDVIRASVVQATEPR
jgi:uncharacterized protein with PQ loop repeat